MPEFELDGKCPYVHPDAFVAPTAVLIGEVEIGPNASVWFGAVLRADQARVVVGAGSNIQDNAVLHCAAELPTLIGENVTIGHNACLEGCVVEDGAVVGMGSIMLQRSRLGSGAMLAAGAVLPEGREVPGGHLAAGMPADIKRPLLGSSARWVTRTAEHYQENARRFRKGLRAPD
jgi:carbonic anhydrase/acetyltransferase-like protein (isoleucine patch superfamily)